jgi:T-complex protein 1 subunit theta
VAALHKAHADGAAGAGLDVETGQPRDLGADGLYDLYAARWWGLKLATDAASTVLRVDQIVMAKTAGGPKPRQGGGDED